MLRFSIFRVPFDVRVNHGRSQLDPVGSEKRTEMSRDSPSGKRPSARQLVSTVSLTFCRQYLRKYSATRSPWCGLWRSRKRFPAPLTVLAVYRMLFLVGRGISPCSADNVNRCQKRTHDLHCFLRTNFLQYTFAGWSFVVITLVWQVHVQFICRV